MIKSLPLLAYTFENIFFIFVTLAPIIDSWPHNPLKISSVHVPSPTVTGDSVVLRCVFDLGNETLYALKWYRNMKEFFRYVPAANPPLKTFPQNGIDVDMSRSDKTSVYLRNLSLESYGNYTCQVSTDKPHFRCVQTTKHMEVVVPPSDGPVLLEEKSDYELGDNVSILCNSGKAKPAPELKWYINDQLAPSELSDQETVVYPDQLESSRLALRFRLQPDVLHNGKVRLKCVATLKHMHAETVKEIRAKGAMLTKVQDWLLFLAVLTVAVLQAVQSIPTA